MANTPPSPAQVMGWSSSNHQWAPVYPPGHEIGYNQITASVNVTGLAASTATTIITASAYTFDGAAVIAEFFSSTIEMPTVATSSMAIALYEGSTAIGTLASLTNVGSAQQLWPVLARYRFTPASGTHTYSIKAWVSSTTGTPNVFAGSAGTGNVPAYLRFIKV